MPAKEKDYPILSFRTGDSKAFTAVYNYFVAPLCFFAESLVQDREVAEDVVEDLFTKFWEKGGDFPDFQKLKAFFYISTKNACINYIISKARRRSNYNHIQRSEDIAHENVLTLITRTEILNMLYHEIEGLPPQCRKIFKMGYFKDLNNEQIAEELGLSVHTVKNQKGRALKLLRERLGKRELSILLASSFFLD